MNMYYRTWPSISRIAIRVALIGFLYTAYTSIHITSLGYGGPSGRWWLSMAPRSRVVLLDLVKTNIFLPEKIAGPARPPHNRVS